MAPRNGAGRLLRAALQAEDGLLAAWVLLQPLVGAITQGSRDPSGGSGASGTAAGFDPFAGGDLLLGLAALAAVLGALACLATRTREAQTDPGVSGMAALGPLTGGLLLVAAVAGANVAQAPEASMALTFAGFAAAVLARSYLPALPLAARRLLVMPLILVGASVFNGFMGQVNGLFDVRGAFASGLGPALSALPPVLGVAALFAAVYYAMLVYAPRQVALPEGGALTWLLRFGVFLAAQVASATLGLSLGI
jgi:hypothetical protein